MEQWVPGNDKVFGKQRSTLRLVHNSSVNYFNLDIDENTVPAILDYIVNYLPGVIKYCLIFRYNRKTSHLKRSNN